MSQKQEENSNYQYNKIKESWYFKSADTLYSLCINLIVRNLNIILAEDKSSDEHLKYHLKDKIGILPQCVSQLLLESYAKYYNNQSARLECENKVLQITDSNKNQKAVQQIISYYDLLIALASRSDQVYLNKIEYKQCLHWEKQQQQPAHLDDNEIKLILNKHCEILNICPCLLTNKSLYLINKYSGANLKFLKLQNYCDWSKNSNDDFNESGSDLEYLFHQASNKNQVQQATTTTRDNDDDLDSNNNEIENQLNNTKITKMRSLESNESLHFVNLSYLSLRNLGSNVIRIDQLNNMLNQCLPNLTYLDISNCCVNQMYRSNYFSESNQKTGLLNGLLALRSKLTYLIMADLSVDDIQANLNYILHMKQIKYLDISTGLSFNRFENPSVQLAKLVMQLNKLTHLDISGTNLGQYENKDVDYIKLYEDLQIEFNEIKTIESDITGLMFLNNEQMCLDFLGFYCDSNPDLDREKRIPALKIASNDCEKNLYTSLEAYMDNRPLFVIDALRNLFELFKIDFIEDKLIGGHLIMLCMEKNLKDSRIQISGSASLYFLLKYSKGENIAKLPSFYLNRLVETVIMAMEEHIENIAMRRNSIFILCLINLPEDVQFISDRLIKILLRILSDYIEDRIDNHTQEYTHDILTSMQILNILICAVNNDKLLVGALAIPIAMNLIEKKIRLNEPDELLIASWSFLWNITDETPTNCKIFINNCDGMSAFMKCMKFKNSELTRYQMGLMCNVAEVKDLRHRLCKNEYIQIFRKLLFEPNDFEVPYNSAGVLVHIMSDGLEAWLASDCHDKYDRQLVIEDIETSIDKWDLKSEKIRINYRSLVPILRLLEQYDDNSICQCWASWALANLTTYHPEIYCALFEKENGTNILNKIINNSRVNETVKKFSLIIFKNINNENKKSE